MKRYLLVMFLFVLALQNKAQTVSDLDGNSYNTVTIGTQVWFKENLKTTKYNDGTNIPFVTGASSWARLITPAYCWIDNNIANKDTFGALYNYFVISTAKLCPTDWHVPTNNDWTALADYLGGLSVAGGKMKEAGTMHWFNSNAQGDNSSGFTGLSQDSRDVDGNDNDGGVYVFWWSSTEFYIWGLDFLSNDLSVRNSGPMGTRGLAQNWGHPVRCLKDNVLSINNSYYSDLRIIYPNPATDKLYIDIEKLSNAVVTIFDLQGKPVVNMLIGSNPLDISNLSKGIYIVKIIVSGKIVICKLIKE